MTIYVLSFSNLCFFISFVVIIEKLDLSHNKLTNVAVLFELLYHMPQTLRQLNLYYNKFGDDLAEIVNHTENMKGLKRLWIMNDKMSKPVIQKISEDLKEKLPNMVLDV